VPGAFPCRIRSDQRRAIEARPTNARTTRIHIHVPVLGLDTYELVSGIQKAEGTSIKMNIT
jgi:hypothetical protein